MDFLIGLVIIVVALYLIVHAGLSLINLLWIVLLVVLILAVIRYIRSRRV